jgi:hypothetical protein
VITFASRLQRGRSKKAWGHEPRCNALVQNGTLTLLFDGVVGPLWRIEFPTRLLIASGPPNFRSFRFNFANAWSCFGAWISVLFCSLGMVVGLCPSMRFRCCLSPSKLTAPIDVPAFALARSLRPLCACRFLAYVLLSGAVSVSNWRRPSFRIGLGAAWHPRQAALSHFPDTFIVILILLILILILSPSLSSCSSACVQ